MSKSNIIKRLKQMKWISSHWRVKDFNIYEDDEIIKFSYYHGDMGEVDMIIYYKKDSYVEVFELNNYYGTTDKVVGLYI